jgi:putative flippase GtrA
MQQMELNILGAQAIRFIGVGILSAVINYSLFYALLFLSAVNYLISSAAGYLAGMLVGLVLNSSWTFKHNNLLKKSVVDYFCLYAFSLVLGLVFLRMLVHRFEVLPEIANVAILIFTVASNFIGLKFWVFKNQTKNT